MKSQNSWSDLPPDPPYGLNLGHKIADFVFLPYISFILAFRALNILRGIGKSYVKSLYSWSDLPPCGSNWDHKIADFVFLPNISFILAFRALECIKRYWEIICEESI